MSWTQKVVDSRVQDKQKYQRYQAGSPNNVEIKQYAHYLPKWCDIGVVMGMTPELRNLAVRHCDLLVSIDISKAAIETYQDWLNPTFKNKEKVIHGNWNDLEQFLDKQPGFIMGDGVFGNVVSLDDYIPLLQSIHAMLEDEGSLITRQCLMPKDVNSNIKWNKTTLIQNFRKNLIDEAEFGLSMRLQGYSNEAYDETTFILDNKKVFDLLETDYKNGLITDKEYEIIYRYFFGSENSIPMETKWEEILTYSGFSYESEKLIGKNWYSWYPIYNCKPM